MASPVKRSKEIFNKIEGLRRNALQGTAEVDGRIAPYFEEDPRDEYYATKSEIVTDTNKYKLGTEVPITSKDIQYIQDQKTKQEKLLFDRWKWNTFQPGTDPIRVKYYEKIDPSWFSDREAEIDKTLAMTEKLALLVLNGPQSEDDVILLYGISTGKIPIPDWKLVYPKGQDDQENENSILQGFFNPKKYSAPAAAYPSLYQNTVLNPVKTQGNSTTYDEGKTRMGRFKTARG